MSDITKRVNPNPSPRELRIFGLVTMLGLGVIGLVLWYLAVRPAGAWRPTDMGWQGAIRQYLAVALWILGVAVFLLTLISVSAARPVYVAWMTAAVHVGQAVTMVLLSAIYFLFLPIFALIRLKDPLRRRLGGRESYWEDYRNEEVSLERMRRTF